MPLGFPLKGISNNLISSMEVCSSGAATERVKPGSVSTACLCFMSLTLPSYLQSVMMLEEIGHWCAPSHPKQGRTAAWVNLPVQYATVHMHTKLLHIAFRYIQSFAQFLFYWCLWMLHSSESLSWVACPLTLFSGSMPEVIGPAGDVCTRGVLGADEAQRYWPLDRLV